MIFCLGRIVDWLKCRSKCFCEVQVDEDGDGQADHKLSVTASTDKGVTVEIEEKKDD